MTNTLQQIIDALQEKCPRLRSEDARNKAMWLVRDALQPVVPTGTAQWLVRPDKGESLRKYAERAYYYAAARASWAGGLTDGAKAYDSAVRESVAAVVRR
jgi:hypothetical protein